ncbi:hypothetical protein NBRC116188_08670 [Oceaniserpentilla sp. 4NH20-0058]|uniref:DUF6962 family protein n=1 Tax=Oceaniserpentilla sp. 4NH20-0058 TaxID=3127660 RepID=UPI00310621E3
MLISLNYAIFAMALVASFDLFRRDARFKSGAIHFLLFSLAALFGGIAHHMQLEKPEVIQFIRHINLELNREFHMSSFKYVYIRVWLVTFMLIGLTEYYFMKVFLYPVAERFSFNWLKKSLMISLIVFMLCSLLFSSYSIVVVYHVFTHLLVIGFSLYLIFKKDLKIFWLLIAMVCVNLLAGGIWALMANGSIPSGLLHYNDWYHLIIMLFIVALHWALTKGGLIQTLEKLKQA